MTPESFAVGWYHTFAVLQGLVVGSFVNVAVIRMPEDRSVVCGMSFGYEDGAHPVNNFRTSRAPVDDVVTWVDE